jgi:tetratricopeptide (TPR) repeat protein
MIAEQRSIEHFAGRAVAMSRHDERGCAITGAAPAALQAYEHALARFLHWRQGVEAPMERALRDAPRFVMAHVLRAYALVGSRDPSRIRSARPVLAHVAGMPANEAERLHLAALAAVLDDDYESAQAWLGALLRLQPRDVLALHMAHAFDHVTGNATGLLDRVAAVLPAWSASVPGYDAVLAMHAFGLEECGEYARAEQVARAALALNPANARAHHVMAHVFEMTARADAGIRWMNKHVACWGVDTTVATHGHWHLALLHLALGDTDRALALYDRRVRRGHSTEVADLIDAAGLLWRIQLQQGDAGPRPAELAEAWAAHIDDAFCSFNDLHAMLAFVAARDWGRVQRLERVLAQSQARPTRHGLTTRQFGLSACRALAAFGRGDDTVAIDLLARLPVQAHRIGGSQAQRGVLDLTLQRAIERVRRPVERAQPERQVCRS